MVSQAEPMCEAFLLLAERFGREHGTPLPKQKLEIGSMEKGWGAVLNPTDERIGDVDSFTAVVYLEGWAVGVLDPYGGCFVVTELDGKTTEERLIEWLQTD